jgi:hypothetical protein
VLTGIKKTLTSSKKVLTGMKKVLTDSQTGADRPEEGSYKLKEDADSRLSSDCQKRFPDCGGR